MKANSKPGLPLADPFHPAKPRALGSFDVHAASRSKNSAVRALASLYLALKGCKAASLRFSRMQNAMQEDGTPLTNAGPLEMMVLLAQSSSEKSKLYAVLKKHETVLTVLVNEERAGRSIPFFDPILTPVSRADNQRIFARHSARKAMIKELKTLASEATAGDPLAFAHLLWMAQLTSLELERLVETRRDVAKAMAKHYAGWPVFLCPGTADLRRAQRLLKSLQVGTAPYLGVSLTVRGRKGNDCRCVLAHEVEMMQLTRVLYRAYCHLKKLKLSNPSLPFHKFGYPLPKTTFVDWLYATEEGSTIREGAGFSANQLGPGKERKLFSRFAMDCTALPEPARKPEVVKAWMRVIKRLLMGFHNDHPEENTHLRKIGWYRRRHGEAKEGSRLWESNIREGMFSKLEQTLRGIFPKSRV